MSRFMTNSRTICPITDGPLENTVVISKIKIEYTRDQELVLVNASY